MQKFQGNFRVPSFFTNFLKCKGKLKRLSSVVAVSRNSLFALNFVNKRLCVFIIKILKCDLLSENWSTDLDLIPFNTE